MKCTFTFEDVTYEVTDQAYEQHGDIRLPDGRVLRPGMWLESYPPKPSNLTIASLRTRVLSRRPVFEATALQ